MTGYLTAALVLATGAVVLFREVIKQDARMRTQ